MDTPPEPSEPIARYLESCYRAFVSDDPRPELPAALDAALQPDSRGRLDEAVERLRRRAEAVRRRRERRKGRKPSAADPCPGSPDVPGYEITGCLGEGAVGRVYRASSKRHFGAEI